MREIKVRFWDDIHNKFWYGGQEGEGIGNKSFQTYFKDGSLVGLILEPVSYGFKDVDDYQEHRLISSQYTGLTDKNGKEIYEDDLIKDSSGVIAKVVYYQEHAAFLASYGIDGNAQLDYLEGDGRMEFCENIGNTYENPELLEGDSYE